MLSKNTFMNCVKRSLVEEGTKGGVRASRELKASKGVGALLVPILDLVVGPWWSASLSCSMRLAEGLTQELHQMRDPRAIVDV